MDNNNVMIDPVEYTVKENMKLLQENKDPVAILEAFKTLFTQENISGKTYPEQISLSLYLSRAGIGDSQDQFHTSADRLKGLLCGNATVSSPSANIHSAAQDRFNPSENDNSRLTQVDELNQRMERLEEHLFALRDQRSREDFDLPTGPRSRILENVTERAPRS